QTYVYVSDPNNHRVQQFSDAGGWTLSIGPGSSQTLGYPINVATDAAGNLYVADKRKNAVQAYSSNGTGLATIVSSVLNSPTGLAIDLSGNIYVGDTGNNRVVE